MANEAVDWERVYRESYPSVYRALAATLLDASLAQDARHDAFLEGLRRPPPHQANIPGWLFRVALRLANRASSRRNHAPQLAAAAALQDELSAVLDRLSVSQLLRLLTERQRAIVVAFFFLDQSQDQIAELLGVRRGTVAATISHALARMRKGGTDVS